MPSGKALHNVRPSEIRAAVEAFNERYGDMEKVLWHLSREAACALLARRRSLAIEVLVWTIRSWWGVQGVRKETKAIAADTLLQLDRKPDYFGRTVALDAESDIYHLFLNTHVPTVYYCSRNFIGDMSKDRAA